MTTPLHVLDVDEVAKLMRCADTTVRERATELGGIKWGRDWVFPAGALSRRLDELALAGGKPTEPPKPSAVLHTLPATARSCAKARSRPRPVLPSLPA